MQDKSSLFDRIFNKKKKKKKPKMAQKAVAVSKEPKDDVKLTKQKVTLHDSVFAYFAYISCKTDRPFKVLANVGGQVFRFSDVEFK